MAAYTNTTIIGDDADIAGYTGAGVAVGFTVTMADLVGLSAEAYLVDLVRYDIVTNWAAIGAIPKILMSDFAMRFIAIAAIAYDMSGYTSRIEAEGMINVHLEMMRKIEAILADQKTMTFTKGETI